MNDPRLIGLVCLILMCGSCKTPHQDRTSEGDSGEFSELKQIKSDGYSLYLASTDKPETYEFVTCDQTVPMAEECTEGSCGAAAVRSPSRPEHCVSSFRSSPRGEYCLIYYALKSRCPRLEEYKSYCSDSSPSRVLPEGYSSFEVDCEKSLLNTIEQGCSVVIPQLEDQCDASYHTRSSCVRSDSTECVEFEQKQKEERFPFQLSSENLLISEMQQEALTQHLRYERYLITMQNPAKQRWQSFGQGSFIAAAFSPRVFKSLMNAVPNKLRKDLIRRSFFGRHINVGSQHLIAGVGTGSILSAINYNEDDVLQDQQTFMPKAYCESVKSNASGIAVPTFVQDKSEILNALGYWAPSFAAGVGTNVMVIRATRKAHPVVHYGGFLVIPFMSFLISHMHVDSSPTVVEQEFSSLLTPQDLDQRSQDALQEVYVSMDHILRVFGRSLIFTRKSTTMSIDQYCLPKQTSDGSYVSECFPIFTGEEGSLYAAKLHGAGVSQICAPYWQDAS